MGLKDLLSDLSGVWQVKFDERRCIAAVQRDGLTYIEVSPDSSLIFSRLTLPQVIDYGAAREGIPPKNLGRRIVVDADGYEVNNEDSSFLDMDDATAP